MEIITLGREVDLKKVGERATSRCAVLQAGKCEIPPTRLGRACATCDLALKDHQKLSAALDKIPSAGLPRTDKPHNYFIMTYGRRGKKPVFLEHFRGEVTFGTTRP
ncbi:hypothetical protein A2686_01645 [Candidatus Woesebacteria bacterium RIFCSPHIGHO2_01_FULL_38_10]|uniref:Uncharacterized protein n=1 Tax=Candidatus Woesebacteria bacterium RIFCSPLOWO2_01_FULL_39_10b TaxID=1802517 RepID=A0A1F8B8C8_9BACT|nr:MAG: hypothetical protein A2686_01645 [Candidatus Woesebacteria bacterium RIFCSPHIGHO2_01_FULL_38_10]OGM59598.1 MAG: hypothetical protein A2892_04610 [Candidatus Woesebacteria bacterium RIFCSPLOWO2_01_FULL_39_10b]